MDFKTRTLRELRDRRSSLAQKTALVGFDGFVDTIVTPVAQRAGQGDNFTPFPTIAEFGQRIVNSCFTLSVMVGVSVYDTTLGTTVGNLGWDEVRFPKPVFHGDTLHFQTEVVELRDTKSRPTNGIVIFAHRAYNQRNELVAACKRTGLMLRKPA